VVEEGLELLNLGIAYAKIELQIASSLESGPTTPQDPKMPSSSRLSRATLA
jgi:hypothetical protein